MTDSVEIAYDGKQVVVRGNTYDLRSAIKNAGFSWDKQYKQWYLLTDDPEEPIGKLKRDLESGYNIQVNVHNLG
jgi:hypothetical protein